MVRYIILSDFFKGLTNFRHVHEAIYSTLFYLLQKLTSRFVLYSLRAYVRDNKLGIYDPNKLPKATADYTWTDKDGNSHTFKKGDVYPDWGVYCACEKRALFRERTDGGKGNFGNQRQKELWEDKEYRLKTHKAMVKGQRKTSLKARKAAGAEDTNEYDFMCARTNEDGELCGHIRKITRFAKARCPECKKTTPAPGRFWKAVSELPPVPKLYWKCIK
eukprot:scaffold122191_cov23-Cyclotella_meneghiniana.AAC.1